MVHAAEQTKKYMKQNHQGSIKYIHDWQVIILMENGLLKKPKEPQNDLNLKIEKCKTKIRERKKN